MKKLISLTISISTLFLQDIFAQTSGNKIPNLGKKYAINIGGSYKDGFKNFGGNIKLDYLINNKTSVGLKTVATNNRFSHQMSESFSMKDKTGLYFISDLTLTYYIIGDNCKSKGGLYFDLGLGYQLEKENTMYRNSGYPIYETNFKASGLGGHTSIGGSLKLGKGRIYSEVMLGGILIGKYQDNANYPQNYPLSKSWINKSGKGFGMDLGNDGIIALNIGYNYCF